MQQYIYILKLNAPYRKPEGWNEATQQIIAKHFEYLKEKKERGTVQIAGKTDYNIDHDDNFGLVIFVEENIEEAEKIMNNDPAVMQGIMSATLYPFRLALNINK